MHKLLVTGSSGLIGSEVVDFFCREGWESHGIDNNMRADFFGYEGDTRWNQARLISFHANFTHHEVDIRRRPDVAKTNRKASAESPGSRSGSTQSRSGSVSTV